jgi:hypothetical protein
MKALRCSFRRRPALRAALLAAVLGAALGAGWVGGCAEQRPPDEPIIDYPARHQLMLDTVLVRPLQIEEQMEAEQRMRQRLAADAWLAMRRRQRAYDFQERVSRQVSQQDYLRLLERQQAFDAGRERERNERWAQFLERRPTVPSASGSPGATP